MAVDRFGNPHAPDLPYARGKILASTEDDSEKLRLAWSLIRRRGPRSIHIFTGLEHSLPLTEEELEFADDEIGPALYFENRARFESCCSGRRRAAVPRRQGRPPRKSAANFGKLEGFDAADATVSHPRRAPTPRALP